MKGGPYPESALDGYFASISRAELASESRSELSEADLSVDPCDGGLALAAVCESVPEEIQQEAEAGGEEYFEGEEHAENDERREEAETASENEEPLDAEESNENSERQREIDASDSNEATEYVHEVIRENHSDLGDTLLGILGAVGAVASIAGLIIVIK